MSNNVSVANVEVLLALKMGTYFSVSSAAFLAYDYLLMLSSEIQYVWQANWGVGKVLYLLSRYPIIVITPPAKLYMVTNHVVSTTGCRTLYLLTGGTLVFATTIAEIILIVRVWSLWYRDIWVGVVLACMAVGGAIPGLVTLIKILSGLTYVSDHMISSLPYSACLHTGEDRTILTISWVMTIVEGSAVFSLMVIVGVGSFSRGIPFSSMMYTFYKDGLVYFASLLAMSIVNLIVNLTQPPDYTNLLLSTHASLLSALSTRMLLNLRQSAHRELRGVNSILDPDPRHRANSITGLRFAASGESGDESAGAA